jgi:hypothetical protein
MVEGSLAQPDPADHPQRVEDASALLSNAVMIISNIANTIPAAIPGGDPVAQPRANVDATLA